MEHMTDAQVKTRFDATREALQNLKAFHEDEAKEKRLHAAGDLLRYGHERSADAYGVALDALRNLANSLGIEL